MKRSRGGFNWYALLAGREEPWSGVKDQNRTVFEPRGWVSGLGASGPTVINKPGSIHKQPARKNRKLAAEARHGGKVTERAKGAVVGLEGTGTIPSTLSPPKDVYSFSATAALKQRALLNDVGWKYPLLFLVTIVVILF